MAKEERYKRDGELHRVTVPGNKYLGIIYQFPAPVSLDDATGDYLFQYDIKIVDCSDLASATDDEDWISRGRSIVNAATIRFVDLLDREILSQVNSVPASEIPEDTTPALIEAKATGKQMMDLCLAYLFCKGGNSADANNMQFKNFAEACRHFGA